jgi:hypothetical protein
VALKKTDVKKETSCQKGMLMKSKRKHAKTRYFTASSKKGLKF